MIDLKESVWGNEIVKTGYGALAYWKPHILYVDGDDTCYLNDCLNKVVPNTHDNTTTSWKQLIQDTCLNDTIYIGNSAGANIYGKRVNDIVKIIRVCMKLRSRRK